MPRAPHCPCECWLGGSQQACPPHSWPRTSACCLQDKGRALQAGPVLQHLPACPGNSHPVLRATRHSPPPYTVTPGLGIGQPGAVLMPRAPKIVQMSQCTGSPGNPAHLTPCSAYTPLLLPDSYWLNLSPGQPSPARPVASSPSELGGLSSAFHLSQGQGAVARHQKTPYIL